MTSATVNDTAQRQVGTAAESAQYLTFTLGRESYGVDILRVQEIKGYTAVTRIPSTPDFIKGVLNLRGTIVPIVDLRTKFAMDPVAPTVFTVIVVVVVRSRIMGLVVDAVSDVLSVDRNDLEPPPNWGARMETNFIHSIAKAGDRLVTVLDIDRVLSAEEFEQATVAAG